MSTCEDQQAGYVAGDDEAIAHVATCPTCGHLVDELDLMKTILADPAAWDEPSQGLEDRVVAAVHAATRDTTASGAAVVSLNAEREKRQSRGRQVPVWAVAAAVIAAVGVTSVVANRPAATSEPDAFVALAGTDLAPEAEGDGAFVVEDNGVEITLEVTGLDRAPKGFFYQAWVKGPNGLVPIGSFHTGNGEIVLWSGVDLDAYTEVTVTLEAEDGNQASSGKRVLMGKIKISR